MSVVRSIEHAPRWGVAETDIGVEAEPMSDWNELRARQAASDPRSSAQRTAGQAAAALRFDLAQLVYDLRMGAGLTQHELAERMGTTQSVISRLEQAGRLPTLDVLARLASATGSDLRLFARREGADVADVALHAADVHAVVGADPAPRHPSG